MKKAALNIIRKFWKNEHGATAIEYGLIAALIAVGIIGGATVVGKKVNAQFECSGQRIDQVGQNNANIRFRNCVRRESL